MNEHEREQPHDEFEVELVNLDPVQQGDTPGDEHVARHRPRRVTLQSRLSPWQRALRMLFTALLVMLALVVFVSFLAQRNRLPPPAATPAPFVLAGANLFYVDASPPWGKLYVDERLVAHPPLNVRDAPLQLSTGQHRFEWRATPFQPIRCTISVPTRDTDACPHTVANIPNEPEAQLVLLYGTMNLLSQPQRQALTQAAQQALDTLSSSDIVQPGEHFLDAHASQNVAVATQPLRATLRFHLDTVDTINASISSCKVLIGTCTNQFQDQSQNCLLFCTVTPDAQPLSSTGVPAWHAIVMVHAAWDYTTLDGQTVALNQPDALPAYTQFAHMFVLFITWNGANWSVAIDIGGMSGNDLACITANDTFDALTATLGPPAPPSLGGFQSVSLGPASATGCLIMVNRQPPSSPTTSVLPTMTPGNTAYCLYRFGLFFAANELAHRYWPLMLLANGYERGLVSRLAARV